ncbi:hypothetical protein ACFY8K_02220 [Streptomyces misionensis]|uniref:hypothetical protein n=1 Tax=Streptomyces misionensis TaxID=67331 RepID=UPI0036AF32C4
MDPAAAVHHEHHRGDVDGRQGDVDHGDDSSPDGGGCGAGVLEEGGDDVGAGLLLRRARHLRGHPVQLGAGPLGDHGQDSSSDR